MFLLALVLIRCRGQNIGLLCPCSAANTVLAESKAVGQALYRESKARGLARPEARAFYDPQAFVGDRSLTWFESKIISSKINLLSCSVSFLPPGGWGGATQVILAIVSYSGAGFFETACSGS